MSKSILPANDRGLEMRIVDVTPGLAREWLTRNTQNRPPRKRKVEQFSRDMANGDWTVTNQGLGFSVTGKLIDGQHRLLAVVDSGATVPMLVVTNLPDDAQANVDTGTARTPGDMLSVLDGTKNAQLVGAIAAAAISWDKGHRWLNAQKPSHPEIRAYVNDPANWLLARAAELGGFSRRYVPVRPTLTGFAFYLCGRVSVDHAEEFFTNQLVGGIGLGPEDPVTLLRRRLSNDADRHGTSADFAKLAYILMSWNKFRKGERLTKLQAPKQGWNVENYPTPL